MGLSAARFGHPALTCSETRGRPEHRFMSPGAFSPDGRYAVTGHADLVWSVAYAPDGCYVATASDDGTARIWDVDYQAMVARLCGRLLRDLTPVEREQHGIEADGVTCTGW